MKLRKTYFALFMLLIVLSTSFLECGRKKEEIDKGTKGPLDTLGIEGMETILDTIFLTDKDTLNIEFTYLPLEEVLKVINQRVGNGQTAGENINMDLVKVTYVEIIKQIEKLNVKKHIELDLIIMFNNDCDANNNCSRYTKLVDINCTSKERLASLLTKVAKKHDPNVEVTPSQCGGLNTVHDCLNLLSKKLIKK
jgi:hypothetical protein